MASLAKLKTFLNQRIPIHELEINRKLNQTEIIDIITPIIEHNPYYIRLFLKRFLAECEQDSDIELEDELYELYCELLSSTELGITDRDVPSYFVGGFGGDDLSKFIAIKETPKLISGIGTTGLRTWEAAVYMSNFLVDHELVRGKRVLELGTGTGLVGLSLAKYNKEVKQVILTDGDSSLIENLNATLRLNEIIVDQKFIKTQCLWWGNEGHIPENDIIIAADVTYDSRILLPLATTIKRAFAETKCRDALISAPVRNENTIDDLERILSEQGLHWQEFQKCDNPMELQELFWFKRGTPQIRIYRISK